METKTKATIGTLVSLALIISGVIYFDTDLPIYMCKEREVVSPCWKLSNPNQEGLSSRCYWNESNSKGDYFTCKTGWKPFVTEDVVSLPNKDGNNTYYLCPPKTGLVRECPSINNDGSTFIEVENK